MEYDILTNIHLFTVFIIISFNILLQYYLLFSIKFTFQSNMEYDIVSNNISNSFFIILYSFLSSYSY